MPESYAGSPTFPGLYQIFEDGKLIHSANDIVISTAYINEHCESREVILKWNSQIRYYRNTVFHRDDGPAIIRYLDTGERHYWYKEGRKHREGGPAEYTVGRDEYAYFMEGMIHRNDGPANVGVNFVEYRQYGGLHREDGPALIQKKPSGGTREVWCKNGKIHREDGPAIIDGGESEWWWNNFRLNVRTQVGFLRKLKLLIIKEIHEE